MQTITNLENLKEKVRENKLKQLGENIVKYQNFKTSAIVKIIDNAGYSNATLVSYVNSGIAYIKKGKKFKQYGNFYDYIDDALNRHVQPLTPKQEQIRQPHYNRYSKIEKTVPKEKNYSISGVVKKLTESKPVKVKLAHNEHIQFGVLRKDIVKTFLDKEDAVNFKNSLLFFGGNDLKLVQVIIKEVE